MTPVHERIRFANQLRGVAALSVSFAHLVGVYWLLPAVVTQVTLSPPPEGTGPAGLLAIVSYPWFNFGPFGVAVFFLISGLVIPFSFGTHGRRSFAVARLLRIYPTYLAALLLQLLLLYAAARAWGQPFTVTPRALWSNALLVYDLVGEPSLDLVNWTLSVELKFYALAILLMPVLRLGRIGPVLLAGLVLLGVNLVMAAGLAGDLTAPPSSLSYTASSHSMCLIYMLIGVVFNFHIRGLLSTAGLAAAAGLLLGCFVVSWKTGVWSSQYDVVSGNYLVALLVFSVLYSVQRFVPANPVLDGMAAISFPYYLVHSLLGYSVLRALMSGLHLPYAIALPMAFLAVIGMATLLHWTVERPMIRAGRSGFVKRFTAV